MVRAIWSAVGWSRLLVASSKIRIFGRLRSARDSDPLLLSARETHAALADFGLIAVGQRRDRVRVGQESGSALGRRKILRVAKDSLLRLADRN
jgi:hypothetical protein